MPYLNGEYNSPTWVNDNPPAINESELQAMNTAINSTTKDIGEMLLSLRTNVGSDYVLCDGSSVDGSTYPDLAELLPTASIADNTFPSGITKMIYAISPNGKYIVRAYTNTIQYYDRDNSTWTTTSSAPSPLGANLSWGGIAVNDSGVILAEGRAYHYDLYGNDWFYRIRYYITTGYYHEDVKESLSEYNTDTYTNLSLNANGYFVVPQGSNENDIDYITPYLYRIGEQYALTGGTRFEGDADNILFVKMLDDNGFGFAYQHNGTTYFYICFCATVTGISLPYRRYGTNEVACVSADMNGKGETVAIVNDSGTLKIKYALSYPNTFTEFTISEGIKFADGITVDDNGIAVFSANTNETGNPLVTFICDIYNGTYTKLTGASALPILAKPKSSNVGSLVGVVDTEPLALMTSDGEYVYTSDNEQVFVASQNAEEKIYICEHINKDGKLPNYANISVGSFDMDDLGYLYVRGKVTTSPQYVNWRNNSTARSVANLDKLSGGVELSQLQIGDMFFSTRTDLDTKHEELLKCSGQSVSSTDYPALYALTHTLPNFESSGINGVHLYVRAK